MKNTDVSKPHIIVSGGSRGLGKGIVEALLVAGYRISTFSRTATPFTEANAANPAFFFEAADISDSDSVTAFTKTAQTKHGIPFGLINCAGIAKDGVIATIKNEDVDELLAVNLAGTIHLTRAVVRQMLLSKSGGSIINISSIIGLRGYSGLAAYAATKGGMDAMTRALARELGSRSIRVNSIAPGYLETEMTHGLGEGQKLQIIRRTPLGRLGKPEDVTGAVLFFLSAASAFITGQVLTVDGGVTN